MQHLLDPQEEPIFEVPYYGGIYRGGNFLTYPQDRGCNKHSFTLCDWSSEGWPIDQAHVFLQEWLFFGLLESVMGEHPSTFLYRNPVSFM